MTARTHFLLSGTFAVLGWALVASGTSEGLFVAAPSTVICLIALGSLLVKAQKMSWQADPEHKIEGELDPNLLDPNFKGYAPRGDGPQRETCVGCPCLEEQPRDLKEGVRIEPFCYWYQSWVNVNDPCGNRFEVKPQMTQEELEDHCASQPEYTEEQMAQIREMQSKAKVDKPE